MKPRFRFQHGRYWRIIHGRRIAYAYADLDAAYLDFQLGERVRGTPADNKTYAFLSHPKNRRL